MYTCRWSLVRRKMEWLSFGCTTACGWRPSRRLSTGVMCDVIRPTLPPCGVGAPCVCSVYLPYRGGCLSDTHSLPPCRLRHVYGHSVCD